MSNVYRTLGLRPALITLAGDAGKGWICGSLACCYLSGVWEISFVLLASFAGHCWSAFLNFNGGKGVATTAGLLLAVAPGLSLMLATIWMACRMLTGKSSLSALLAALMLTPMAWWLAPIYTWTCLLLAGLVVWRHTANIHRLLSGDELPLVPNPVEDAQN